MRNFKDGSGTEWMVYEVRRQGNEEDNWAYLPRGFRAGWLCFESDTGKRRLSPVPDGWKSLDPSELERMMRRATPVVRGKRDTASDDADLGNSGGDDFEIRA
jgi:hypothetical protein